MFSFCQGIVLQTLREMLSELLIARAKEYRTQDLRRGHADDLRRHGGRMCEIYKAGTWRPSAKGPFSYLDLNELEAEAVDEAVDPWSSDSEEET